MAKKLLHATDANKRSNNNKQTVDYIISQIDQQIRLASSEGKVEITVQFVNDSKDDHEQIKQILTDAKYRVQTRNFVKRNRGSEQVLGAILTIQWMFPLD